MIKFSLKCDQNHAFESWFKSGAACDGLIERALVTCPHCASTTVQKALMTPSLGAGKADAPAAAVAAAPAPELEQKLRELRAHIETHSDYVGDRFAAEARAMYLGEVPDRPIHGEARLTEARALLEEGIPVLPLPFVPTRNSN